MAAVVLSKDDSEWGTIMWFGSTGGVFPRNEVLRTLGMKLNQSVEVKEEIPRLDKREFFIFRGRREKEKA